MKKVLILCTGNSCRSQMAEGWLRYFGGGRIAVYSAGTRPSFVHPLATRVMKESGIDLSSHRSKSVEKYANEKLDIVITVCDTAHAECPSLPGAHERRHMPFDDPAPFVGSSQQILNEFRRVRDQISKEMKALAEDILRKTS